MSLSDMTVEEVVLNVEQFCASMRLPYEVLVDGQLDYMTDAMLVMIRAHIWGEKREVLVEVPDGLVEYVKHHLSRWKYTPMWLRKRIRVRYIDWQAVVFRAYPDFKAPRLRGPGFDRCVVHTMQPLNLTELSR